MTTPHSDHPVTQALHRKIDQTTARAVVTPLYQTSAFTAESPYFYTRKSNPNSTELEEVVACLEGARHAVSVTTGMTAISVVMSLLKSGDHLVLNRLIYGCSYKLFQRMSASRGIRLSFVDLTRPEGIESLPADTTMVFFETPTNPFLRTISIGDVTRHVKAKNPDALVVVDNSWATPLHQKPLAHGADISVYSATKFFAGHSDVMGGMITVVRDDLATKLREERFYTGAILDPHSAWLIRRSMQTFVLRMKEHVRVTGMMETFLGNLPQITRVHAPKVDGKQLVAYGGILFCDLREDLVPRYTEFSRSLRLFDTGTAMACVTSMVAQPFTGSHASMTEEEKTRMGLGRNLIRLCFGMEDVEDLKYDLQQALAGIDSGTVSEGKGARETCHAKT